MISFIKKNKKKVETSLYIALTLLVIFAIFQLYGMVMPTGLVGQAYDLENNDVSIQNVGIHYAVVYAPIPTVDDLSDTSMHYNWKVNSESLSKIYYPMEVITVDGDTSSLDDLNDNPDITATVYGATLSDDGVSGKSLSFDETQTQYANINDANMMFNDDFAVEFWFNIDDTDKAVLFTSTTPTNGLRIKYRYFPGDDNIISIQFMEDNDGEPITNSLDISFPDDSLNKWHHMFAYYIRDANRIYAFLDDEDMGNVAFGQTSIGPIPATFRLGASDIDFDFLNGQIDELRIYESITNEQISKNYQTAGVVEGVVNELASASYSNLLHSTMYEICDDISVDIYQFEAGELNLAFSPFTLNYGCGDGFMCNPLTGDCELDGEGDDCEGVCTEDYELTLDEIQPESIIYAGDVDLEIATYSLTALNNFEIDSFYIKADGTLDTNNLIVMVEFSEQDIPGVIDVNGELVLDVGGIQIDIDDINSIKLKTNIDAGALFGETISFGLKLSEDQDYLYGNEMTVGCDADADCENGLTCNLGLGVCELMCNGAVCQAGEECLVDACVPVSDNSCVGCEGTCVSKNAVVDFDENLCVSDSVGCQVGAEPTTLILNFPVDDPNIPGETRKVIKACRGDIALNYKCINDMGIEDISFQCLGTEQCFNGECIPAGNTCEVTADCIDGICFKPGDEPGKCIDTNSLPKGEAYCIDGVTSIKYLGLDIHGEPEFVLGKCQFAFDLVDDGNGCYVVASSMPGQIYNLNIDQEWISLVDDNLPLIGGIEGESKDDLYFISNFPKIPDLISEFQIGSPNVLYSYDGGLMKPIDLGGSTSEFYSDVIDLGTEKLVLVNNIKGDGFFIPMLYKSITTDVGVKWSFESLPTNTIGTLMTQMFSPSSGNFYFLGVDFLNQEGSKIIQKKGDNWLTMETALNVNLAKLMMFDLWGTSPDNMYFLGYGSESIDNPYPVLLHTENNILENQIVEVGNNFEDTMFYSIWGNSENDIYLVGYEMDDVRLMDENNKLITCDADNCIVGTCNGGYCTEEHSSGVMYHYNGEWEEIRNTGIGMLDKSFLDVWGDGQGNVYVSGLINGVEKQNDISSSGIMLHKDPDNDWSIKQFDDIESLMTVHGVCDNCDETSCGPNLMCSLTGACVCKNDGACSSGKTCVLGQCLGPVNCIDDSGCTDGRVCLLTDIQEDKVCHGINVCENDYQCNANNQCVMTGNCVECRNDGDCEANYECSASNVCVADAIVDNTVNNNLGGSSSSSNNNNCVSPKDPIACSKQKDTTPCVGGKIIYTCDSTCGTSLLFQYDCDGNTASFAPGCNNQVRDIGEIGIDCGGICDAICPDHCKNGVKDDDETGIDCGGKRCAPCEVVVEAKTQDDKEQPPVLQEPKSNLKWLWLSLIPLIIAIGLVVFLIMRKHHHPPRTESFGKSITKEGVTHRDMPKMDEPKKVISKMPPLKEPIVDKPHFNEQELKDFVKGELHSGKNKEGITKSLERLGYTRKEIKNVFEEDMHNVLPPKYEKQIRNYILSQLDKGKTPAELRKLLTKQGWNSKVIDKFLIE
jgi:hypothetical protein